MKDAVRLVYTLTPMSVEEAQAFGVNDEQRRLLIRMDSGKVNITTPLERGKMVSARRRPAWQRNGYLSKRRRGADRRAMAAARHLGRFEPPCAG